MALCTKELGDCLEVRLACCYLFYSFFASRGKLALFSHSSLFGGHSCPGGVLIPPAYSPEIRGPLHPFLHICAQSSPFWWGLCWPPYLEWHLPFPLSFQETFSVLSFSVILPAETGHEYPGARAVPLDRVSSVWPTCISVPVLPDIWLWAVTYLSVI